MRWMGGWEKIPVGGGGVDLPAFGVGAESFQLGDQIAAQAVEFAEGEEDVIGEF